MLKHDQYLADMHDGVTAVHIRLQAGKNCGPTAITDTEAARLHKSINATLDPDRMKDDTIFRTNGVCGAGKTGRINGISKSFHQLNMGLDGG